MDTGTLSTFELLTGGSVQIATLPSSKLYLNLENDSVLAMRQRLIEEGYTPTEHVIASEIADVTTVIEKVTLKTLSEVSNEADIKGDVDKIDGKFKCIKCPKIFPIDEKRSIDLFSVAAV
ncbi:hypothetical protein ACET3Z_018065 [Daucus carota]